MPLRDLASSIERLERALLEVLVGKDVADYDDDDWVRLRSYVVLAHAELEECLEEAFLEHLKRAAELLGHLNARDVGLRAFWLDGQRPAPAQSPGESFGRALMRERITAMHKVIKKNHGLKASNIEDLATAVGVDYEALEQRLSLHVAAMTTLGTTRGDVGHHSPFSTQVAQIRLLQDMSSVMSRVHDGREAVIEIDRYLRLLETADEPEFSI